MLINLNPFNDFAFQSLFKCLDTKTIPGTDIIANYISSQLMRGVMRWLRSTLSLITGSKFVSWNSYSYSSLDRSVNKTLFHTWNHLERLLHGCSLSTTTTMLAG